MQPAAAIYVSDGSGQDARRIRLPWLVAAALLLFCGVLLGVLGGLGARRSAPVESAAPPAREPTVAVEAAGTRAGAPRPPADTASATTSFLAALPPAPKPARGSMAPSPRRFVPEPPAPARAAAPSAPPAAVATSAAAPKVDCDPPFYFEGTKKVFKPSCL